MTDIDLQDKLKERVDAVLETHSLKRTDGEEWYDFNVYKNEIPVKTDYNDMFEENYIVILISDEDEMKDGSWKVEIQFIIGYHEEDDERQGHYVLCTLMNEIFMDLAKHEPPGNMYERLPESAKRFAEKHIEGFYEAALIMSFKLPAFIREDLREFL